MKYKLTSEEKDLMNSLEKEEWVEIENFEEEKSKYEKYAAETLKKNKGAFVTSPHIFMPCMGNIMEYSI